MFIHTGIVSPVCHWGWYTHTTERAYYS